MSNFADLSIADRIVRAGSLNLEKLFEMVFRK